MAASFSAARLATRVVLDLLAVFAAVFTFEAVGLVLAVVTLTPFRLAVVLRVAISDERRNGLRGLSEEE